MRYPLLYPKTRKVKALSFVINSFIMGKSCCQIDVRDSTMAFLTEAKNARIFVLFFSNCSDKKVLKNINTTAPLIANGRI